MADQIFESDTRSMTDAARGLGEKTALRLYEKPFIPVKEFIEEQLEIDIIEMELSDHVFALVDLENKEIILNIKQNINRLRFTLAHEVGHIMLNHKKRKWTEYANYSGDNPDKPIEEEANAFASGFLIPSKLLRDAIKHIKNPKELAAMFKVSEESMWYALDKYHLINKLL